MFPLSAISDRRPFALSALPEFIALMGASDFRSPPPSSSLFRLVRRCALPSAPTIGSPWLPRTLVVRLDAVFDPGVAPRACQCARERCCLLVRRHHRPTHQCKHFGTQLPSGAALPVPFAPRLLLCLRIKHPVTGVPARLNTRPVASGYLRGIRTRQTARHCQAATSGASGWSSSPGGPLTHWKAPPYHGARQFRTFHFGAHFHASWIAGIVHDCPGRRFFASLRPCVAHRGGTP